MLQNSEEIVESTKAIQELAKTTGKAMDGIREFCGFIATYTGGSLSEAIGIFEDKLKYARWKNQVRIMNKAKEFLKEQGLEAPNKGIEFKLAVPLLQAASLEEDDHLQDMWAKLLANAANQNSRVELHRVYIDILERLSALDVQILERIYSIKHEETLHRRILTWNLPETAEIDKGEKNSPEPGEDIKFSLLNLDRLNCISIGKTWEGWQVFDGVNQTLLGRKFVDACTIRADRPV